MCPRELAHAVPGYGELPETPPQSAATWAGAGEWPTLPARGANDSLQDCIIRFKLSHYEAIWENKSEFITEERDRSCCKSLLSGRCSEARPASRSRGLERLFPRWQELRSTAKVGWPRSPLTPPTAAFCLPPAICFSQDTHYTNKQTLEQRH